MTQEHEPIKLNKSTPEPKENGIYLLTITFKPETKTVPLYKDGDEYLGADSSYSWGELVKELSTADEATIQSLAAHDAQIRAEALDFSNEERDLMLKSALDFTETDDAQEVDEMIAAIIGSVVEHRKEQKQ